MLLLSRSALSTRKSTAISLKKSTAISCSHWHYSDSADSFWLLGSKKRVGEDRDSDRAPTFLSLSKTGFIRWVAIYIKAAAWALPPPSSPHGHRAVSTTAPCHYFSLACTVSCSLQRWNQKRYLFRHCPSTLKSCYLPVNTQGGPPLCGVLSPDWILWERDTRKIEYFDRRVEWLEDQWYWPNTLYQCWLSEYRAI